MPPVVMIATDNVSNMLKSGKILKEALTGAGILVYVHGCKVHVLSTAPKHFDSKLPGTLPNVTMKREIESLQAILFAFNSKFAQ
jgi:hypothetical protein